MKAQFCKSSFIYLSHVQLLNFPYLIRIEGSDLAGDGNARLSVAEPPHVTPHGDVAVPVGTHVVLVKAVVGEEGADGDVVGGVEPHVHDPRHDAVVGPHGAGVGREGAE